MKEDKETFSVTYHSYEIIACRIGKGLAVMLIFLNGMKELNHLNGMKELNFVKNKITYLTLDSTIAMST